MNKAEFNWRYVGKNIVVNCPTEELAEEFLEMADNFGYKWNSGDRYTCLNYYRDYADKTCYCLHKRSYADLDFYIEKECKVVVFKGKHKKDVVKSKNIDFLVLTLILMAMWIIKNI